jgi:hypothetical protein
MRFSESEEAMSYRKEFENALARNTGLPPGCWQADLERIVPHGTRPQFGIRAADEADDVIERRNAEEDEGSTLIDADCDGMS